MAKNTIHAKQADLLRGDGTFGKDPNQVNQIVAGQKLAKQVYAPASQTTSAASSATMAAFDSANITTGNFTAPPSGQVTVKVSFVGKTDSSGVWVGFGLAVHGAVSPLVANEIVFESSTSDAACFLLEFTVTGLTPGESYAYDLLGCATSSGSHSFTVYAFGQTTVTPNLTGSAGQGSAVTLTVLAD